MILNCLLFLIIIFYFGNKLPLICHIIAPGCDIRVSYYSTQNLKESLKKCKTILVEAWTGPEVARRLRLPDCKTIVT
jgi:hypothetical protein